LIFNPFLEKNPILFKALCLGESPVHRKFMTDW